jgi:transcriptional antiterminator RfaH
VQAKVEAQTHTREEMRESEMGHFWYVVHTKPRKETVVCTYLESEGFEVFFPTMHVKPVNPRSSTLRPYFPRYLFIYADLEEVGISALQWIPGAIGLVQFGEIPARVPDVVVYHLRKHLPAIQAAGGMMLNGLKPGDPIQITQGPLAGYKAVFDARLSGTQRVRVLLDMLGRQVRAEVNINVIEKKAFGSSR